MKTTECKDWRARLMGMFVYLAEGLIDDIEWPSDIERVDVVITMKDGTKHEGWVLP